MLLIHQSCPKQHSMLFTASKIDFIVLNQKFESSASCQSFTHAQHLCALTKGLNYKWSARARETVTIDRGDVTTDTCDCQQCGQLRLNRCTILRCLLSGERLILSDLYRKKLARKIAWTFSRIYDLIRTCFIYFYSLNTLVFLQRKLYLLNLIYLYLKFIRNFYWIKKTSYQINKNKLLRAASLYQLFLFT